jgi:hypothetical protein
MKKTIVSLAVLGLAVVMPKSAFAVFSSISRSTNTAVVALLGGGTVQMTITLHNISDNSTTTQVYWTTNTVVLPTSWVLASAYIRVASTMTQAGGGIQIYTDNKAADASPAYTGTGNPMGLIDTTTTTKTLAMAWSVKDTTATAPTAGDPNDTTNHSDKLFFKDRQTAGFTDGETFIAVKRRETASTSGRPTPSSVRPRPRMPYTSRRTSPTR